MDTCSSGDRAPDTTWYFGSESDEHCCRHESEKRLSLHQPWRAYWPPTSCKTKSAWLRSEFPEVLSWRFDKTLPFDRPWRIWARSARALEEKARSVKSTQDSRARLKTPILRSAALYNSDVEKSTLDWNLKSVQSAGMSFLAPLDIYQVDKPYLSRLPSGTNFPRTNIITSDHRVEVFDLSGHESSFSLADSGFEFTKSPVRMQQWNDISVCSQYIPQMEMWLKDHFKCAQVLIYAYNFRGNDPAEPGSKSTKTPFFRAHCDATPTACVRRLQLFLPEQAPVLGKQRVRFLNIWRPITTPNQDSPLAVCDYRSLNPDRDLVAADIIFPHYQDEAYEVLYNPKQRWFYKKGMDWDDVIVFKLGDSQADEAPLCPHSAFIDHSVPNGTPARKSIEIRAMIIG
ncbi:hypothetical protein BKA65DRAFT_550582 [Rhexocercosporidium sp. MPI-PUGE-AT-0058]|nr:hypothetical protein BKA65DRAFT_550582 [Rhexocercosporidium sp. MPI-PUGE-AT-0058]